MKASGLLQRLKNDGIENLWVIYHDYSGRSCAKTIPKEGFTGAVEQGVVFARANLDFTLEDHQAEEALFLAETGDFLAVPDPASYAPIPYHKATARVHAFMRADDGTEWAGCPRTQLQRMVDSYAASGLSVRVAFEPEFILFEKSEDGEYRPADRAGMFSVAGLDRHYPLWQAIIDALRQMGVRVDQLGKEYGPGQYEASTHYDQPLKAVDNYLTFKEVLLVHSGYPYQAEAGYMANMLPQLYCDVSEGIPFAGQAARRIYAEVLEMAPLTKVTYGADGYLVPEIAYVGALLGKQALAQALEALVQDGLLTQAEAQEAAGWILAGNARRLYGLAG